VEIKMRISEKKLKNIFNKRKWEVYFLKGDDAVRLDKN
jgi:hypothetical protein